MIIYFTIFITTLISIIIAVEIVFLTKKALDRSYRFFTLSAVALAVSAFLKILLEMGFEIHPNIIAYVDLIFAFLFLDGLILMRRLIKKIK